jgi:hypothetical protein
MHMWHEGNVGVPWSHVAFHPVLGHILAVPLLQETGISCSLAGDLHVWDLHSSAATPWSFLAAQVFGLWFPVVSSFCLAQVFFSLDPRPDHLQSRIRVKDGAEALQAVGLSP